MLAEQAYYEGYRRVYALLKLLRW